MAFAGVTWTSSTANSAVFTYNKWVCPTIKFNNGSGKASCTISDNGFLGLMSEAPEATDTIIRNDLAYGIAFDTTNFYKVINGQSTLIAGTPTFASMSVVLAEGHIKFFEGAVELFSTPYDYNTTGYYVIAGVQNTAQTIKDFTYNPQSFTTPNTTDGYTTHTDNRIQEIVQLGALVPTVFTMVLSDALASLLGFSSSILKVSAISKTFTASIPFEDSILSEAIEVHLVNVGDVKSYDSVSKKAQQIIAVIPIGSPVVGNKLAYSAPEILYVDLNNKFDIPVSSLTFRIVGAETGNLLIFESGITLTLAVRSKKEIMY